MDSVYESKGKETARKHCELTKLFLESVWANSWGTAIQGTGIEQLNRWMGMGIVSFPTVAVRDNKQASNRSWNDPCANGLKLETSV